MTIALPSHWGDENEPLLAFTIRFAGNRVTHRALSGMHVVELMRAHGLPVRAECGGAGACATCHVHVPPDWRDVLPPPSSEELAKLDEIPDVDDASRLACQIIMTEQLDGLELELQADSQLIQSAPKGVAA